MAYGRNSPAIGGGVMKNAHSTEVEAGGPGTGAVIIHCGTFPARHATLTAEVLRRFLEGERLASLEAVHDASTTRLAAVVEYLQRRYNWVIERQEKANGCRDGRVSWVTEYSLMPETIAAAMAANAGSWCASVKSARAKLRATASDAYRFAARANARQVTRRPGSLLNGEGVST